MTDVSLELQGEIYDSLRTNAGLISEVGARIRDRPEKSIAFPYVSFGPVTAVSDDADCITAYELDVQIDVWSRAVGSVECKTIADLVRIAVLDGSISLTDNALVMIEHRSTRYLDDPDGITHHAAISFTAVIEQG